MTADDPAKQRVLLIGLAPEAVDLASFPDVDRAQLTVNLQAALEQVTAAGFEASWCLTGAAWDSAGPQIAARLAEQGYAAVMIGAGIRTAPAHVLLFERIVNLVHEAAPGARLCFNSSPSTTLDAVLRWLTP